MEWKEIESGKVFEVDENDGVKKPKQRGREAREECVYAPNSIHTYIHTWCVRGLPAQFLHYITVEVPGIESREDGVERREEYTYVHTIQSKYIQSTYK